MIRKQTQMARLCAWMIALLALVAGRSLAQDLVAVESPRAGSGVAASTWARPWGRIASSSGVGGAQVLLQRASGGAWLSWSGSAWGAGDVHRADTNVAARTWAWPASVALPVGEDLAPGRYRLRVTALSSSGGVLGRAQSDFVVGELASVRQAAPANDLPGRATRISGVSGRIAGTNVGATPQDVNGNTLNGDTYGEIWYRWAAPQGVSGRATFNSVGSSGSIFMRAYIAQPNGNFTDVNLDGLGAGDSLSFVFTPGYEYMISLGARFGQYAPTLLTWSAGPIPPNDTLGTATVISGLAGRASGQNLGALGHDVNNAMDGSTPDVWWRWRAPASASTSSVFVNTAGSSFTPQVYVFRSVLSDPNSIFFHAEGIGSVRFNASPSDTYYIEISNRPGSGGGNIALSWSVNGAALPPVPPTTGSVRGRVLDAAGKGQRATVFLVPGNFIDPLLFTEAAAFRRVATTADGSYAFANVEPGAYLVVPQAAGVAFGATGTRVSISAGGAATADFRAASTDSIGPEVVLGGVSRAVVGGTSVVTGASGTVSDRGSDGKAPSGTFLVGYAVYKLKSDVASLKLPPGKRGVSAIFSDRTGSFVSSNGSAQLSLDNASFVRLSGSTWATTFTPALQNALKGSGTYRIALFALDKALNNARNAASSTDPNRPASSIFLYGHFETTLANLAVTRTLPLSAPNGSTITYALSVTNTGDQPLARVSVTQTINTDKTVLNSASISPRPSAITNKDVVWSLGTIAPHSTRLLKLTVRAADNNPFGSNISAGKLSVASSEQNLSFGRDQVNIESSAWIIGGALNALRAAGDAIGSAFNRVFGSSVRDQRAQADLGTVRGTSVVTRLAGADALRFGNGALLVAAGGGNLVAAGGGNIIAAGGGNLVAAGGGNIVAAGGGNLTISGVSGASILSRLESDPASVLSNTSSLSAALKGANLVILGGNNLVAAGGGNLVAAGGGNIVAAGGGNFVSNASGLLASTRISLVGQDGGSLIGQDGGSLKAANGAGLLSVGDGAKLAAGRGNTLIGQDGGSLIGMDGASLIAPNGRG